MQNKIRIQCPAKINLTLEVINKREDGFHNIKSIMQTISLYDYLTISVNKASKNKILLSGTDNAIPYDENNLVYKAADLFLKESGVENLEISIHIEKNIPIAAGLAGGSADAAGTLWGLNYLSEIFDHTTLDVLCAKLGSDLNVCLHGGCVLATGRGEIIKKLPSVESEVTLIKPKNLGISAREAYTKYSLKENKPQNGMTEKMLIAILDGEDVKPYLYNDLESAVFCDYKELQNIKKAYPESIMSGSGSTFFVLGNPESSQMGEEYLFINGLKFTEKGIQVAS